MRTVALLRSVARGEKSADEAAHAFMESKPGPLQRPAWIPRYAWVALVLLAWILVFPVASNDRT